MRRSPSNSTGIHLVLLFHNLPVRKLYVLLPKSAESLYLCISFIFIYISCNMYLLLLLPVLYSTLPVSTPSMSCFLSLYPSGLLPVPLSLWSASCPSIRLAWFRSPYPCVYCSCLPISVCIVFVSLYLCMYFPVSLSLPVLFLSPYLCMYYSFFPNSVCTVPVSLSLY